MPENKHKSPRLPPLTRLSGLRQLGARLIREAMREERSIEDASRLMSMVRVQAELILASDLEARVEYLATGKLPAGVPTGTHFRMLGELKKAA